VLLTGANEPLLLCPEPPVRHGQGGGSGSGVGLALSPDLQACAAHPAFLRALGLLPPGPAGDGGGEEEPLRLPVLAVEAFALSRRGRLQLAPGVSHDATTAASAAYAGEVRRFWTKAAGAAVAAAATEG
jgi:hypothetical protein